MLSIKRVFGLVSMTIVMSLGMAGALYAANGVTPISQGLALAGNVTPGDTPGFPVSITQPGAYILTSDLVLPDAMTVGIVVQADDVTINLNGFTLSGPTVCSGTGDSLACAPTGTGIGIGLGTFAGNVRRNRIVIRNGRIRGTGGAGIDLQSGIFPGTDHVIEDVVVSGTGGLSNTGANSGGIRVGTNSTVRRCVVDLNAGTFGVGGTWAGFSVVDSTVYGNKGAGIIVASGVVQRNLVTGNGGIGIWASGPTSIMDNSVLSNAVFGIDAGTGGLASRNVLQGNGGGIGVGAGSVASRNVLSGSGTIGGAGVSALDNFCDGVGC